jgi:hypothetical protein
VGQPYNISKVNLIADVVPYPRKYAVNGSMISLIQAPGIYNGFQFLSIPSTPDAGRATFSMAGGLSYPAIIFGTTQISDYIRIDVVPANTSFVPDKYGFDPTVTYDDLVFPDLPITTIAGLDTVATAVDYGFGPYGRSELVTLKWIDKSLPKADYRVVLRVLKSGRDYDDPASWNTWLVRIFRMIYLKTSMSL